MIQHRMLSRRDVAASATRFVGRAVEYNRWSELPYGKFHEQIAPGTFDESLRSDRDVFASVDHNPNMVLGRLSAGTLKLLPDERGIAVECSIGGYSYAADLATAISRGDLRGMSFIFDVLEDRWENRDGVPHRTVTKADLYEVAFVFFPAYPATTAGMRSEADAAYIDNVRRRMRIAEALAGVTPRRKTPADEADYRRRRLALAEAECGLRQVKTVCYRGTRSTLIGRDAADLEKLRHAAYVNAFRR